MILRMRLADNRIPRQTIYIKQREHQVDIFQLAFAVQPAAIHPDNAERQAKQHRPKLPTLDNADCACDTKPNCDPLQLLFKNSKIHQFHMC